LAKAHARSIMGDLCEPNEDLLEKMVALYLQAQPIGKAIGNRA
jgi:hypothetical protein